MKYKTTLFNALDCYCEHCGRGDEATVKYVKKYDKKPEELYKEVCELPDYKQRTLVSVLIGSNYNIFTPWFKSFLVYCKGKEKHSVAESYLKYYKNSFDKVKLLGE